MMMAWSRCEVLKELAYKKQLLDDKVVKAKSKNEVKTKISRKMDKDSDKTFYCYDFNKGKCLYPGAHEGKFNCMNITKKQSCKVCWQVDTAERKYLEVISAAPIRINLSD